MVWVDAATKLKVASGSQYRPPRVPAVDVGMATCSGHDTHPYPRRSAARATSTMSSIPPRRSPSGGSQRGFRFTTGVTIPRRIGFLLLLHLHGASSDPW